METTTFRQLLADGNRFGVKSILIPKIQRSYAQGRTDPRTSMTRTRFLDSIHGRIAAGERLTLDFVYGHIDKGQLIPLDGQQRLTTLWMLHWYAARKGNVTTDILSRFSYNTRYSARDFIIRMADYKPQWNEATISAEIENEGWFPLEWRNDPTVRGMLVMLDAIEALFADIPGLWERLDLIDFYFLPLEELQLTDEIYIKMNSRGKPLTDFEHFKAELLKTLRNIDGAPETGEEIAKRIGRKIDIDWTDMLWGYRGSDNLIDDEFLRYFRLVCHLMAYRDDRSYSEISGLDDFRLIGRFFTGSDAYRNVLYLESLFDCWLNVNLRGDFNAIDSAAEIRAFFTGYLSPLHEAGKSIPLGPNMDIFEACLRSYPFFRMRPNVMQWLTTLFAFITFLHNRERVSDADFRRRLRIILNLQKNSGNEIVDTPKGDAGNRMPAILRQVERIILEGAVGPNMVMDGKERPTFNSAQLAEESAKLEFTAVHPEHAEPLFILEDHPLLEGRVVAVGYENTHLYDRFADLFASCSRDAIDCAMLATADYAQRRTIQTIQLGSGNDAGPGYEAWFNLFHPTEKIGNFEGTALALRTVLERSGTFDDTSLRAYAREYEAECERNCLFDWRYYYLRYEAFRAKRYGKYTMWADAPYELVAIYAPKYESSNAYQPFLYELADRNPERFDNRIRRITYRDGWLVCLNDRFRYLAADGETVIAELPVPQHDGVDTVDRLRLFCRNPL